MNCGLCQQELSDLFGRSRLPQQITDHIDTCPDCREVYDEMVLLSERMGANTDFTPDRDRLKQLVANVEQAIVSIRGQNSNNSFRNRFLAIAASVILMFGVASISYRLGTISGNKKIVTTEGGSRQGIGMPDEEETLDETTISILLDDYIFETGYEACELLLDDLTDEEFDYLKKNLDVGGML
jgi:predicted anti-sigma-YlaC factor YlaD